MHSWELWLLAARAAGQKTQPHTAQHDARPTFHGQGGVWKGKAGGEDPPLVKMQHSISETYRCMVNGGFEGKARGEDPPLQGLQHSNSETNLPGHSRVLDVL